MLGGRAEGKEHSGLMEIASETSQSGSGFRNGRQQGSHDLGMDLMLPLVLAF